MPRRCLVPSCSVSSKSNPGFPLFSLPLDDDRRSAWLRNMQAQGIPLTRDPCVCLRHFEDKYVTDHGFRVTLSRDAVPTIITPGISSQEAPPISSQAGTSSDMQPMEIEEEAATGGTDFSGQIAVADPGQLTQEKMAAGPGEASQGSTATVESPLGSVAGRYLKKSMKHSSSETLGTDQESSELPSSGELYTPEQTTKRQRLEEDTEKENQLDPSGNRVFLVNEEQLRVLLRRCVNCGRLCDKETSLFSLGVDIRAEQDCAECSKQIWRSFPTTEARNIHLGNFTLTAATTFAGNTYQDLESISANMNLHIMSKSTFYRYSNVYIYDSIDKAYLEREQLLHGSIRLHQRQHPASGLRLAVDGRFSQAGHTATYGVVTALDIDRGKIISCHVRKKNDADVSSSSDMETVGTRTVLNSLTKPCGDGEISDLLLEKILIGDDEDAEAAWEEILDQDDINVPAPIKVESIVTDDNPAVTKMMSKSFPKIRHDGDPWHVIKSIRKRLAAMAKKAATREIGYWSNSIANFLRTAMTNCNGDGEILLEQWRSIGYHIVGEHKWHRDPTFKKFKRCGHTDDYSPHALYVEKNTPAHKAILALINDADLQRRIVRCCHFMQTSAAENFHNVLCKYNPKRLAFGDRRFAAGAKMAVMDWEENYSRGVKTDQQGNIIYSMAVPPAAKDWRIKRVPFDHSYKWSQKLMVSALNDAIEASLGGKTMKDTRPAVPDKTLVSAYERPNRLSLLERDYRRRYGEPEGQ